MSDIMMSINGQAIVENDLSQSPAQTLGARVASMGLPARVKIIPLDPTTAEVTDLLASEPGIGQGKVTMRAVLALADELGVTLEAEPVYDEDVEGGLDQMDLEDWYVRLGFKPIPNRDENDEHTEMDRYLVRAPLTAGVGR